MRIIGQSCDHKSGLHRKPALGMARKNRVGYIHIFYSCNMGTSGLATWNVYLMPKGHRPEGKGYTFQAD